jgi:HAMP domain-containing protein
LAVLARICHIKASSGRLSGKSGVSAAVRSEETSMRNRLLVFVLFFSLTCGFLGLLYVTSRTNDSMTLADLTPRDYRRAGPSETLREQVQSVRDGRASLPSLDLDLIFYAVLGACGGLLVLRAVVSAVRIARIERLARSQATNDDHISTSARPSKPAAEALGPARSLEIRAPAAPVGVVTERSLSGAPRSDATHWLSTRWLRLVPYGLGLTGKMIFTITAIIAAFGSLMLVLVYFTVASSLTKQSIQRARLIALNVSDSLPAYLFKKDAARLREFLRKYASRPGMAYIVVEGRKGEIVSHSFAALPPQVQNIVPSDHAQSAGQRLFRLGDAMVHEVSVPVLEGPIGAVRVGIWKGQIDDEISKTLIPIVKFIALVFCGGILMASFLTWRITRPIVRLVRTARRVSEGELDVPSLSVDDIDEFGELSRSFERMRSSVKAAMTRLDG